MYNDKQGNFEGCWTMQGTLNRPVVAQTVVPNMTWFKVSHFYCPAVHGLYAAFHVRKIEFLLRFVEKFSALCFPVLFVFVMFSGLFLRWPWMAASKGRFIDCSLFPLGDLWGSMMGHVQEIIVVGSSAGSVSWDLRLIRHSWEVFPCSFKKSIFSIGMFSFSLSNSLFVPLFLFVSGHAPLFPLLMFLSPLFNSLILGMFPIQFLTRSLVSLDV